MLRLVKLTLSMLAVLAIGATAASAAPVVGTGNPPGGVAGTTELNWLLGGQQTAIIVNPATPFWVDPASQAGVTAQWISPYMDPVQTPTMTALGFTCAVFCPGDDTSAARADVTYTYALSFDNPGQTVNIKWATDNTAEWFLNDVLIPQVVTGPGTLTSLFAFSLLATDFVVGENIFKVVVTNFAQANGGNPTGLLVDISTVPLPPAVLLFGSALLGLNWLRRRHKGGSPMRAARA